ncbi:hypothetical protein QYE76_058624 [Lolium multiflorum]|uniref:Uncharacterized protein n=1 Tax=Lolium multiflorum TaxID=4521 RepID=A0AAD8WSL6_LOLMU|nr:hypothetical protein QYE76_058624 [Lolium multiflorum]
MGLIFPPTTTERVVGAPPAVEPNRRHAISSPATSGRRTEPQRRFMPRAKSSKRKPRTVSSASASARRRPGPNLASPPPLPPPADSTTCWSCLAGPVVTDPDSGALVCASCGLVHDLGAAEFFHQTADEVACLVIHGTDEPVADLTCWPDSDADSSTLVCALHGLVHGLGATERADLGLPTRIARPPRAVEHEAAEENKEL